MAGALLRSIRLDAETDFDGFRRAARTLLAQGVLPESVTWSVGAAPAGLFDTAPPEAPDDAVPVPVPAFFHALCKSVVLHADPLRFAWLYRALWRLAREPALRHDPIDPDLVRLQQMAREVRRDMHKMKAFVRFRPVDDGAAQPLHVAWFEPGHNIVQAIAPFFARRFAQMRWAILTPRCSVRWSGAQLAFGPGAQRAEAPAADAGEQLWLTYYEHIFNPARLKIAMMCREMPRRYWHNLPEAALIAPLAARAAERTGRMIEAAPTVPARRSPSLPAVVATVAAANPADAHAALLQAVNRCRDCPIGEHATQAVFGEGPLNARLMLVGEQPGEQEDLRGRPFVGPAGRLLDQALAALGWPRDALYLTNAVKHFKYELRGKRRLHKTAAQREADACLHWLESEIELVQPAALIALGATAARALLGRSVPVLQARGQWFLRADGRRVLVTLHPSALLRATQTGQPDGFAAWLRDLEQAGAAMVESPAGTLALPHAVAAVAERA
jgi:uracil-DNA glycosylase